MSAVVAIRHVHDEGCENRDGDIRCGFVTNLREASQASVDAEKAWNMALFEMTGSTVALRHLAEWRRNHPEDAGAEVAIKRSLEKLRGRENTARVTWTRVLYATTELARELGRSVGVCFFCGANAPDGLCDECAKDEVPF